MTKAVCVLPFSHLHAWLAHIPPDINWPLASGIIHISGFN